MKYTLYRTGNSTKKLSNAHELIAVEYGNTIEDVINELIRDICTDLAENEEYSKCEVTAYPPEPHELFSAKELDELDGCLYNYEMLGIVIPPNASQNILVHYGIIESDD